MDVKKYFRRLIDVKKTLNIYLFKGLNKLEIKMILVYLKLHLVHLFAKHYPNEQERLLRKHFLQQTEMHKYQLNSLQHFSL